LGFVLTILYLVTYYLSPPVLFGSLAAFHVEEILAALVILASIPALLQSSLLKLPQTYALIGLSIAAFLSILVAVGWPGGAVQAFLLFIPNGFAFFLVVLHCNSKTRMKLLVFMLFCVCAFVIARGSYDLAFVVSNGRPADQSGATESRYVLAQFNGPDTWIYRLMGQGEIHDPNDFAQLLVCLTPLMFIYWQPKRQLANVLRVILPVCLLLTGLFLTHSRGGLVAFAAVVVVALRRRIGTVPSLVIGGVLILGAIALNVTGGRAISAQSGSDRTALWGEGLGLLKAHPVFGVGFGQMMQYSDNTAHNSIVVCAAELGFAGLYFWSLFLLPSIRDVMAVASPSKVNVGQSSLAVEDPLPQPKPGLDDIDKEEINRLGRLLLLALTGFLAASWFLSRAFVVTLFLLGGLVEVVYEMAVKREMIAPRLSLLRSARYAAVLAVALIVLMYLVLRLINLTR
jgi:O-antigen ligase